MIAYLMVWHGTFIGQVSTWIFMTMLNLCTHLDRRRISSKVAFILELYNDCTLVLLTYIMKGYAIFVDDG